MVYYPSVLYAISACVSKKEIDTHAFFCYGRVKNDYGTLEGDKNVRRGFGLYSRTGTL